MATLLLRRALGLGRQAYSLSSPRYLSSLTAPPPNDRASTPATRSPLDDDDGVSEDSIEFTKPIDEEIPEISTTSSPSSSNAKRGAVYRDPVPKPYLAHREAMKKKHPEGWNPPKKLSRALMEDLRTLNYQDPTRFTTAVLAERFKISPEAVRRILRSKWVPSAERLEEKLEREREVREKAVERWRRKREMKKVRRQAAFGATLPASPAAARAGQERPEGFIFGRREERRVRRREKDDAGGYF